MLAHSFFAFFSVVVLSLGAAAQTPPRCVGDSYNRLDFWLGVWDVRLADGTLAGTDIVEKSLDGCTVLEHWSDVTGAKGESLFYYRPSDQTWNQVWTTPFGVVKEKQLVPAEQPHAIRFAGAAFLTDGRTVPDRTTLVAQNDGTVRQIIEQSADSGATWRTLFDAVYTRRGGTQPQASKPSCDGPEYRQFDFWIGDWEVTTPDGKPAGRNVITREMNGCVIHEHWAGIRGMKGESFNIWHRDSKRWHQTWVSDRGDLLQLDGSFREGAMQMTGVSGPPDRQVSNRITWSPASDGTVRQHWEVSSDGEKSWKTAFDGRYRRVEK